MSFAQRFCVVSNFSFNLTTFPLLHMLGFWLTRPLFARVHHTPLGPQRRRQRPDAGAHGGGHGGVGCRRLELGQWRNVAHHRPRELGLHLHHHPGARVLLLLLLWNSLYPPLAHPPASLTKCIFFCSFLNMACRRFVLVFSLSISRALPLTLVASGFAVCVRGVANRQGLLRYRLPPVSNLQRAQN